MKRSFIREILEHTNSDTISFAGGLPDESLFPIQALREAADRVLSDPSSLQYSTSTGYEPLKRLIAQRYSDKGFPTDSSNIIITSGSQQALDIICRHTSAQSITIEQPSYLGAINIFGLNNIITKPIPLKTGAISSHDFAQSLQATKLAYLIPDFQNPTGARHSQETRQQVAQSIKDTDSILIEDSPYEELYFDHYIPSISSTIPTQSYHLGSFSKTLAPALRVGWIRADATMIQPLIPYKEAMDLHTSSLSQQIIYHYLNDGDLFEHHLDTIRQKYKEKMIYFTDTLDKVLPEFEYGKPDGGMFVYGTLKDIDTSKLVRKSIDNGVVFVPGIEFGGSQDEIRFNFTNSSFKEIDEGIKRIKEALL